MIAAQKFVLCHAHLGRILWGLYGAARQTPLTSEQIFFVAEIRQRLSPIVLDAEEYL
jgi:hypothetical protein